MIIWQIKPKADVDKPGGIYLSKTDGVSFLYIFRIASLSKIFPTLMLYKLWQDGLVDSLDDPLEKYAINFTIKNPLGNSRRPASSSARTPRNHLPAVTLRRMASQLSGNHSPPHWQFQDSHSRETLDNMSKNYMPDCESLLNEFSHLLHIIPWSEWVLDSDWPQDVD